MVLTKQLHSPTHWKLASEYYPDLNELALNLSKISWRLSNSFKAFLIDGKAFEQRHELAGQFESLFIETYFGSNEKIKELAKILIVNKNKKAARELNKAVNLLDIETKHIEVIKNLSNKYNLSKYYDSLLFVAVNNNNFDLVNYYIKIGANVNIQIEEQSLIGLAQKNCMNVMITEVLK